MTFTRRTTWVAVAQLVFKKVYRPVFITGLVFLVIVRMKCWFAVIGHR